MFYFDVVETGTRKWRMTTNSRKQAKLAVTRFFELHETAHEIVPREEGDEIRQEKVRPEETSTIDQGTGEAGKTASSPADEHDERGVSGVHG